MPLSGTLVEAVAASGRLDLLQRLLTEQQCPRPLKLSKFAAYSGSISMLDWLRTQIWCTFDSYTCAGAAKGGHLAALKHLISTGLIEWLRQEQGVVIDYETLQVAASEGQTALCAHLRSMGCAWDDATCFFAADRGHLDTLCWLVENGCSWDVRQVCLSAASEGCTNILDYVVEQGEGLDAELLADALNNAEWPAVLGYDEEEQWSGAMIAWARAEGCTSLEATVY
eukprot:2536-Heterococcus_DN1.PRE.5